MADTYNVVRGDGVFFEGMTKEQIIAAIAEATGKTVEDIDSAFITKIKEINKGNAIRLWMGTNAEYNALETKEDDVLYYVTDDTFVEDTNTSISDLQKKINANYNTMLENFESFTSVCDGKLNTFDSRLTVVENELAIVSYYDLFWETGYDNGNLIVPEFTLTNNISVGSKVKYYVTVDLARLGYEGGYYAYAYKIRTKENGTYKVKIK